MIKVALKHEKVIWKRSNKLDSRYNEGSDKRRCETEAVALHRHRDYQHSGSTL